MHAVADSSRAELQSAVMAVALKVRKGINRDKLHSALAKKDAVAATAAIPFRDATALHGPVSAILVSVLVRSGKSHAPGLAALLGRRSQRGAAAPAVTRTDATDSQVEVLSGVLDLLNPASLRWVELEAGGLIQGLTDEELHQVQAILFRSFQGEYDVWRTAQLIQNIVGLDARRAQALANYADSLSDEDDEVYGKRVGEYGDRLLADRAETIARTETIAAANEGQQALWDGAVQDGIMDPQEVQKKWIVTPDDKLCDSCAAVGDNDLVDVSDQFDGGDFDDVDHPPLHPRCLVGSVGISGIPGLEAATRAAWSGMVVRVITRGQDALTVTPKHLVLTTSGWRAAELLKPGDQLICYGREKGVGGVDDDAGYAPPPIKQVFEALRPNGTTSMRGAEFDLDGDEQGFDGEVDVVRADRVLGRARVAALFQPVVDDGLGWGPGQEGFGPCYSSLPGTARLVRTGQLLESIFGPAHGPLQQFGLALAPRGNAGFQQPNVDTTAVYAKLLREGQLGNPELVVYDEVVSIDVLPFHGYVYDLQTSCSLYFTTQSQVVVSNCRCAMGLVYTNPDTGEEVDEEEGGEEE